MNAHVPHAARRALEHVTAQARGAPLDPTLRVTVHFHPDRLFKGEPVLRALAKDGAYRSQFETGTSNGGLTAFVGGDRWAWEDRIFGGAYNQALPSERPKYGALNIRRRAVGASPRFGSAYVQLAPHTQDRTTFCFPDSASNPQHFGVASRCALEPLALATQRDFLDDYVEAHIHGPLILAEDVEALVLDPCFKGTEVEGWAEEWPCPVRWHQGFRLHTSVLKEHASYRGQAYVELGLSLAKEDWLTPRELGEAAATGVHDPQDLKKVWHLVARFGGRWEP